MVHGLLVFIWAGGYFVFRLVFVVVAVRVCVSSTLGLRYEPNRIQMCGCFVRRFLELVCKELCLAVIGGRRGEYAHSLYDARIFSSYSIHRAHLLLPLVSSPLTVMPSKYPMNQMNWRRWNRSPSKIQRFLNIIFMEL